MTPDDLTPEQRKRLERVAAPKRTIVWGVASDVEPRATLWLWRPYLPLGKVVLVAGAPGHGKSQLSAALASLTTRAEFYPSDLTRPGRAVVVSAEDDLSDTVVPRLMAAHADLRMVEFVAARTAWATGLTADGLIELPGDVAVLHERLKRGDVRLLVLDPVVSFFGREHSTLSNQDVRKVLDPLKAMADAYMATIVVVLHLNKASEVREWASRIAESHGFQAVARSVLALGPDPDDEEGEGGSRKVLALTKANLIRRAGQSMRLEIRPATVWSKRGAPIETSFVEFTGPCDVAADDLLMTDEQRRTFHDTRDWLLEFLGDDWRRSGEVESAAIKAGHSRRTLARARMGTTKRAKQHGVPHGPWWIAATTTPTDSPGSGIVGDLGRDRTPITPRVPDPGQEGGTDGQQARQGRQVNLEDYRRERDRRLGERDDDD